MEKIQSISGSNILQVLDSKHQQFCVADFVCLCPSLLLFPHLSCSPLPHAPTYGGTGMARWPTHTIHHTPHAHHAHPTNAHRRTHLPTHGMGKGTCARTHPRTAMPPFIATPPVHPLSTHGSGKLQRAGWSSPSRSRVLPVQEIKPVQPPVRSELALSQPSQRQARTEPDRVHPTARRTPVGINSRVPCCMCFVRFPARNQSTSYWLLVDVSYPPRLHAPVACLPSRAPANLASVSD